MIMRIFCSNEFMSSSKTSSLETSDSSLTLLIPSDCGFFFLYMWSNDLLSWSGPATLVSLQSAFLFRKDIMCSLFCSVIAKLLFLLPFRTHRIGTGLEIDSSAADFSKFILRVGVREVRLVANEQKCLPEVAELR